MSAELYFVRHDNPPGLVNANTPMPYGYQRWNGAVWCDVWVDTYNRYVRNAVVAHRQGLRSEWLVDSVYRLARSYDQLS